MLWVLIRKILCGYVTLPLLSRAMESLDRRDTSMPDKYFSYFSSNIYVVGTCYKGLGEALLMSTHNTHFHGEIRKTIFCLKTD